MSKLFSEVLRTEAKARDLNVDDVARLLTFSNRVAEIESNNIADRTQGDSEKGIGRGKYQFENAGGSNAAKTAANRLAQWEEQHKFLDIPKEDRVELGKDSPDFSKLSEDTQDALFIINMSIADGVPLTDIAKGKVSDKEAWIKYHWAGDPSKVSAKESMWDTRFNPQEAVAKRAKTAKTFVSAL